MFEVSKNGTRIFHLFPVRCTQSQDHSFWVKNSIRVKQSFISWGNEDEGMVPLPASSVSVQLIAQNYQATRPCHTNLSILQVWTHSMGDQCVFLCSIYIYIYYIYATNYTRQNVLNLPICCWWMSDHVLRRGAWCFETRLHKEATCYVYTNTLHYTIKNNSLGRYM